ncbi:Inositol 2-dehydrogenase/D-chiro-inositol 3-dehydrogenase [Dyadobacter sp. CECT 9623]|uniref:Inositol 2-dehydrogenase/D-chiro-inositol 3-dehydrogenase n=1 Tax=Dyadobacter linearis TaxID=2823330 RepID=A0ABM8UTW7_9BACT|nr:bi-domain-containing oxidoreductase [Dyadobacter sp. CECT 9623]CAG5071716.1 Inositol 2-dehydrogenase/D-chiro-inositol 3-dehydrogenase [Dyadobacter sp. CECT 9623]
MKQLALNLRTGKVTLREVPVPTIRKGYILIKTRKSLISAGTERTLVNFGKSSLLSKIRQQPEKLDDAFAKIRSHGFINTVNMLSSRLDQLMPLGYCQVGEVIAIGEGVEGFRVGDRVVNNGCHAEAVCIPTNLVAKVPENVSDEDAVFTVMAAVGMQGIRLLKPALGETVAVIGLGLIGLLTAGLLRINGCRVICLETDEKRIQLGRDRGLQVINPAKNPLQNEILGLNGGNGVDGVLITATSTSDSILRQAALISRKRGKIVVVGSVGMNIRRADFYEKELTVQVSCSYGPGRYDRQYEEQGVDYPYSYVRWTENRNFQSVLHLFESGALHVKGMISETITLENAPLIYGNDFQSNLATVIDYPASIKERVMPPKQLFFKPTEAVIGIIGAGNFTRLTMLPLLKGAAIKYISSANGLTASELAQKYRIPFATTGSRDILEDNEVDLVMIATRHNEHARQVIEALNAGKHVFVEKPLAIFPSELDEVIATWHASQKMVFVGFNRRFSPYVVKMRELLGNNLMHVTISVNAGHLPENAWLKDRQVGGGRMLGECCHFIDLIAFLTQSPVAAVCSNAFPLSPGQDHENVSILLRQENGSTGVVNYFSNGHHHYQKERIEVSSMGRTLILDDFKCLTGYGFKSFGKIKSAQDKGHKNQFAQLLSCVKNGENPPVSSQDIINPTRATFAAVESLSTSGWIYL